MIAGTGAYAFFRRALQLAYWPSVVVAWCYPLTLFFVPRRTHTNRRIRYPQIVTEKLSHYDAAGRAR